MRYGWILWNMTIDFIDFKPLSSCGSVTLPCLRLGSERNKRKLIFQMSVVFFSSYMWIILQIKARYLCLFLFCTYFSGSNHYFWCWFLWWGSIHDVCFFCWWTCFSSVFFGRFGPSEKNPRNFVWKRFCAAFSRRLDLQSEPWNSEVRRQWVLGSINSHEFHIVGDKLINPIVGVYIPI